MVNENLLQPDREVERVQKRAKAVSALLEESTREAEEELDKLIDAEAEARERTVAKPNLAKLDTAIDAGRAFERDMQALIEQLTSELEKLGRKVTTTKDFTAGEKVKGLVSERWANRSRLNRIRRQSIDGSMRTVLSYAQGTVASINEQINRNTQVYKSLASKLSGLSSKLKDNQPRYEKWREAAKDLEVRKKDIERSIKVASEQERPELQEALTELQMELDQAKINETSYFEIVRNAEEALDVVRMHAEGFKQAIDALVRAKFKTAEKIDNLTEVFTGIYQIMETSLEMKGFSRIDQTLNYAADKTTEAMNVQLDGILDEARVRNEKPLIDDAKMTAYLSHMREIIERFAKAMEEQRQRYASRHSAA